MDMQDKLIFMIPLMILFFGFFTVWAQTLDDSEPFIFAYTQSAVRNPEGTLLVYQENFVVRVSNPDRFNTFLDQQIDSGGAKVTLIDNFGQIQEMIEVTSTTTFETDELRAWDSIGGKIGDKSYRFAIIYHEGYPVTEGDILTVVWTFIRNAE